MFIHLKGEIDHETAHTMSLPRCGVKDKVGYGTDSRSKRYALQDNDQSEPGTVPSFPWLLTDVEARGRGGRGDPTQGCQQEPQRGKLP
uniref:Uncharacterized protein n=1 Tax=Timema genevievae TaxID=629358 RepID=A0A7R9K445_TIMGE|nr:unnamed protein product [Timema genevievae]